jgi:hypothetical protein
MHFPSLPAILPIAALLSPRQTTPNYEPYTPCAENCFVDAAFSDKCVYTTPETAWVTCVCNNDDEQASIARCIYTSCGAQTLNDSAPIHEHNCQINGSPSTLSEEQFIAYGEEAATTGRSSPHFNCLFLICLYNLVIEANRNSSFLNGRSGRCKNVLHLYRFYCPANSKFNVDGYHVANIDVPSISVVAHNFSYPK